MITETRWLGLLLCTEENQVELWPLIAWPTRLRVEAKRVTFGGSTYSGVITKPAQFSRWNGVHGTLDEKYWKVRDALRSNGERQYPESQIRLAEACAEWVLGTPRSGCPLPDGTFYFYAPVSMRPPGSLPKWNWKLLQRFCYPGVDPWRLVHAREVKP